MIRDLIKSLMNEVRWRKPASQNELDEFRNAAGILFPNDYQELLLTSNGLHGYFANGEYLRLDPFQGILETTREYLFEDSAPGVMILGSNGADEAYCLDTRRDPPCFVRMAYDGTGRRRYLGTSLAAMLQHIAADTSEKPSGRAAQGKAKSSKTPSEALVGTLRSGNSAVPGAEVSFLCLAIRRDGEQLLTCGCYSTRLWDLRSCKKLWEGRCRAGAAGFAADGRPLVFAYFGDGSRVIEAGTEAKVCEVTLQNLNNMLMRGIFSADGRHLVAYSSYEPLEWWDVQDGRPLPPLVFPEKLVHTPDFDAGLPALAASPDGSLLAIGQAWCENEMDDIWKDRVTLVDFSGKKVAEWRVPVTSGLAFSPDSKRLLGADVREAQIFSIENQRRLCKVKMPVRGITGVAFHPDGERFLLGTATGSLHLYDAKSGKELWQADGNRHEFDYILVNPNGEHAYTAGKNRSTVSIWRLPN